MHHTNLIGLPGSIERINCGSASPPVVIGNLIRRSVENLLRPPSRQTGTLVNIASQQSG